MFSLNNTRKGTQLYRVSPLHFGLVRQSRQNYRHQVIAKLVEEGAKLFELGLPTMLTTDWSIDLGFFLQQKHSKGGLVFSLESTRIYTLGDPDLMIDTDHKPLVGYQRQQGSQTERTGDAEG